MGNRMRRIGQRAAAQRLFGSRHQSSLQRLPNASCWGNPDDGRLGFKGELPGCAIPRVVHDVDQVVQVACGGAHTLFLTESGHVYSAGSSDYGQLGHGDKKKRERPERIEGIENALSVSAGSFHSVVVTADGMFAFGRNNHGQLGLGHDEDTGVPSAMQEWPGFEGGSFRGVACGGEHSMKPFQPRSKPSLTNTSLALSVVGVIQ